MAIPMFANVNTLGITYTHGEIREHHFETIFHKIMGIPESEIAGVDDRCEIRFIFKVTTKERFDDICSRFTCKDIFLEHGNIIRVDDISTEGTMVELRRVPFDLSNKHLKILLSKYGNVNKCQSYFHKYGNYSIFSKSGHRIAWIDLKCPTPRILNIGETQNFLNVSYSNQPFVCNKCGKTGHRARQCNTKVSDYVNVIDVDSLQDKNSNDDDKDDEIVSLKCPDDEIVSFDTADVDIHIASSQSTNQFTCNKCDYKCSYEAILQEHMLGHTSEGTLPCTNVDVHKQDVVKTQGKDFKCFICGTVSLSKSAYDVHLALHDIDIQLSCSECDFECSNEDVLNNHISSHNTYKCKVCNFTFTTAENLSEHGRTHNPSKFNCTDCEYKCSTKTELKNHKKQHTGEKNGSAKRDQPDHSISPEGNVTNKKAALRSKNPFK